MVGFIFDSFGSKEANSLLTSIQKLGKDRIYHVTISPYGLSAKEVAEGRYDRFYENFFHIAQSSGAKFVFRTMHEMNGSWYSWSGKPEEFKAAWHHVYELSRKMGLSKNSILFDFSINSEDLPSTDGKINGPLYYCTSKESAA